MCNTSIHKIISLLIIVISITSCGDVTTKNDKLDQIDRSLCQFSEGSCDNEINGVKIALFITPKTVPSEKNLTINVKTNEPVNIISARIEGRDMFMGIIPIQFNELINKNFSTDVILGSCASGYMVWRLFVTIEKDGISSTVFFDFLADNG